MSLPASELYAQLLEKACWSHANGRNVFHILQADIDAARLFSYGYRSQAIGTFHATRLAIEAEESEATGPHVKTCLLQARILLEQLEAKAGEPVPQDFRALISTLYYYDQWVNQVADVLQEASVRGTNSKLEVIRRRFVQNIAPVSSGNGIYVARDLVLPEQGAFVVPNLGISIVPVIYGDYHSWNAAFLTADQVGVSVHRHHKGAEIHLGFSPVKGLTILGENFAEVSEGYAMAIPPMTDHGFFNTSGHDHIVPFIFGSLTMTGWGIFFDVEPRSDSAIDRREHPLESPAMNHSAFLERAIQRAQTQTRFSREVLIPAERAGSREIGGLELAVSRVHGETPLSSDHYRIVSVQSGKGRVRIGAAQTEVSEYDHFGVPVGLSCTLTQLGDDPLVFLDAMVLPVGSASGNKT
jgi:mannose-6-phosphate isomerase-like protein (cupin superfamily)